MLAFRILPLILFIAVPCCYAEKAHPCFQPLDDRWNGFFGFLLSEDPNGIGIGSLVKDGPLANAKAEEGDVIQKIGGIPVKTSTTSRMLIASLKPGQKIEVEVLRNGDTVKLNVIVGRKPAE